MTAIFIVTSAASIIIGIAWYRSDPVSAGRPGSLLVLMGALGIGAVWWVA